MVGSWFQKLFWNQTCDQDQKNVGSIPNLKTESALTCCIFQLLCFSLHPTVHGTLDSKYSKISMLSDRLLLGDTLIVWAVALHTIDLTDPLI